MKTANLAVYFLLELCAFAALGYWGWNVGNGVILKVMLAIGLPLAVAVIWGLFLAPRASRPLPHPAQSAVKLVIFLLAAGSLAMTGQTMLAGVFAVAAIVSAGVVELLHRETQ